MSTEGSASLTADSVPVAYSLTDEVATITLNDPEKRNVLSIDSLKALASALTHAAEDPAARVVVITGAGNTFCAGADLKGASAASDNSANSDEDKLWDGPQAIVTVLKAILDHPKPTIARVQGHVAGGGNGLVAACDLAVATESAKFAYSEVRVGVAPAVISVVCLRKMNVADGYELFLTGERISAMRALEAGLINKVTTDSGEVGQDLDALDAQVATYTAMLRQGGPEALKNTKRLLNEIPQLKRDDAFEVTAKLSAELFGSEEAAAGMGAFLKREKPPWIRS